MKTFLTSLCICVFATTVITHFATAQNTPSSADSTKKTSDYKDVSLEELSNFSVDELSSIGGYKGSIFEDIFKLSNTASKVSEKPWESPSVLSVVSAKEIAAFGAITLADVLDRLTSTFMMGTFLCPNNMLSMRGDNTEHHQTRILVLIDGRPMRESYNEGTKEAAYLAFPLDRIDRIEVIRGPGSVLYGSTAFVGVINIVTKTSQQSSLYASGRYGAFNTIQATGGGGLNLSGVQIDGGVNYLKNDGWDYTQVDDRSISKTIKQKMNNFGANMSVRYEGFRLNAFYGFSSQTGIGRTNTWLTPVDFAKEVQSIFADAEYKSAITEAWTASLNVTYNRLRRTFARPGANDDNDRASSDDFIVETTHYLKASSNLNFTVGGLVNIINGSGVSPEQAANGQAYNIFTQPRNPNPFVNVNPYNQTLFAIYGQGEYHPWDFLRLLAGVQLNQVPGLPLDPSLRFAAIASITPLLGAKVLYGEAFRAPSSQELLVRTASIYGNLALKSEQVQTLEAQVYYADVKNGFQFTLTYFNNFMTDLISRSRPQDSLVVINGIKQAIPTYINLGNLTAQGLEFEGQAVLAQGLSLRVSATYQTNVDNLARANYNGMPTVIAKAGLAYSNPIGIDAGVFQSYFGGFGDIKAVRTVNPVVQPFSSLTANVQLQIGKWIGLSQQIALEIYGTNLLDAVVSYPEYVRRNVNSIPGRPSRALYATLRVQI